MTPEQALDILVRASGEAKLTRHDHIAVDQALSTLRLLIENSKPK